MIMLFVPHDGKIMDNFPTDANEKEIFSFLDNG